MRTVSNAEGGFVVSLDAFKLIRQGITREHDDRARWTVKPLSPWARDLLRAPQVLEILRTIDGEPLRQSGDGFITPERGDLDRGVGFKRKRDALNFIQAVEAAVERGPWG